MTAAKEEIGNPGYLLFLFHSFMFVVELNETHLGGIDSETCLKAGSHRGKAELAYG